MTPREARKAWERANPLTGPTCPCGAVIRKRRIWIRWDHGVCQKCGRRYEYVGGGFIFGPKPRARVSP